MMEDQREKKVDRYCVGCQYLKKITDDIYFCSYMLDTDKRRPCPPGRGCTVRTLKKRGKKHENL